MSRIAIFFNKPLCFVTVLFIAFTLSGCVNSFHKGQHEKLVSSFSESNSHNVLILPSDIQIFELGVTGTEEVPEWTDKGTSLVDQVVNEEFSQFPKFTIAKLPDFTVEEKALVEQYTELYYPVVDAEFTRSRHPAWEHDELKTQTTLGTGLAFLKHKYNVDYIIFVSGQDYISTGGRKAAALAAAVFGVAIPMGFSYLSTGVVESETGHVLWNNFVFSQDIGFLEEKDVSRAVLKAMETLPEAAPSDDPAVLAGK